MKTLRLAIALCFVSCSTTHEVLVVGHETACFLCRHTSNDGEIVIYPDGGFEVRDGAIHE